MEGMQWLMVAIFFATFLGLVKFQQQPEKVFAGSTLACLAMSFVTSEELLGNAVNSGLVTLLLLVVCSYAIERTGFLRRLSAMLINGSVTKSYLRTLIATSLSSAVMNNTAVVATLIGPVSNNTLINPGRLLLPLSYAAILGGTLTLIGTSTNLIVNSMLIEQGQPGLAFFDFFQVGIVALVVGMVVLLLRVRSLPETKLNLDHAKTYMLEAKLDNESKMIGKSVEENGLRNLDSLFLVEIVRRGRLISPVAPDEILEEKDKLIFSGDVSKVFVLQQFDGLKLFAEQDGLLRENLTEVLIKHDSAVVGKTLKQAGFRARFDAAVVAIRREGETLSGKLGELVIQSGDFLILAVGHDFSTRTNLSKNFFILSGVQPDNMLSGWREKITLWGFVSAIAVSVLFEIPLLKTLIFYVATLVAIKGLVLNELKRRFPIEIWIIVLSALTLAKALDNTGVAQVIADSMHDLLSSESVYVAFIGVYILALLMTELVTNNAAAALVFPIAYNIGIGLGVDPMPFIMAVAFAASGSFISPYGYQTNIMVYNAGNYRLRDFIRFGFPMSLAYSAVVIIMVPRVFPF